MLCREHSAAKSVLIADDHPVVRRATRLAFEEESDFIVCGEAENGREAIEKSEALHPDLVIMDLSMPVMNGLDVARVLKHFTPSILVIIFTGYADVLSKGDAGSAGISAVISKSQPLSVLIDQARDLLRSQSAA